MAPISDEIEVKDEPWIHSSEYDQVSYGWLGFYFSRALGYRSSRNVMFFSLISKCLFVYCNYISISHFFSSTMIKMAATLQRVGR